MAEKRGGRRPGAGRPKGARAKARGEPRVRLQELARAHTQTALDALVPEATSSESDSAKVAAANALLDRGYGKPSQALEHSGKVDTGPGYVFRIETVSSDDGQADSA